MVEKREGNISKVRLYIDVDAVLLGKSRSDDAEIVLAKYAREFLEKCLEKYDCYWLTSHCKEGDNTSVLEYLNPYVNNYEMELLKNIKSVEWDVLKTEAIDLKSEFYWIDDQLLQLEKDILEKNDVSGRWIQVNTRKNPNDLKRALLVLNEK